MRAKCFSPSYRVRSSMATEFVWKCLAHVYMFSKFKNGKGKTFSFCNFRGKCGTIFDSSLMPRVHSKTNIEHTIDILWNMENFVGAVACAEHFSIPSFNSTNCGTCRTQTLAMNSSNETKRGRKKIEKFMKSENKAKKLSLHLKR